MTFVQKEPSVLSTLAMTSDRLDLCLGLGWSPELTSGLCATALPTLQFCLCHSPARVNLRARAISALRRKHKARFIPVLTNPHQWTPRQPGPQHRTGQDGHLNPEAGRGEGNGQFTPAVQTSRPLSLFLPKSPVSTPAWLRATLAPLVSTVNTL